MVEDIVRILVQRDNISENDAWNLIENCQEELSMVEPFDEAETAIYDWLGLEPDYLVDLLV